MHAGGHGSAFFRVFFNMNENSSQLESFCQLLFLLGVLEQPPSLLAVGLLFPFLLLLSVAENVRQRSWEKVYIKLNYCVCVSVCIAVAHQWFGCRVCVGQDSRFPKSQSSSNGNKFIYTHICTHTYTLCTGVWK